MDMQLFNTLSKTKEVFKPSSTEPVKMYVCGITPYDYAHIGHGRVYVSFDILIRLLRAMGHEVTYVRNITDIDDKLLAKAAKQGNINDFAKIAEFFTAHFEQEMQQLGCLEPSYKPRVTECVTEIIAFIVGLIEKKHAYVLDGDVYFDVLSFSEYGRLSKRNLDDMLAGARVDVNVKKRHPADFALWKSNVEGSFWQSPWGNGRPGWHIECSVMAKKYLGTTIDIHGGGMDLIFPHHENEIAQSEALHHEQFARFWLHNAFVNINKEKMSKSLGNIIPLKDLLATHDPMVVRFFYLQHHYRTPIDFSDQDLVAAATAYKKLVAHLGLDVPVECGDCVKLIGKHPLAEQLLAALCDDLNTPKFLGIIFENLSAYKADPVAAQVAKKLLVDVLGLTLQPLKEQEVALTPEIERLLQEREQARTEKNWAHADKIRDELLTKGYKVQDKKS